MQLLRKFFFLMMLFVSALRPAYGDQGCQDCDTCGEAYSQSSYTAHWSAYVPIAVLIAAGIWFGVADSKSDDSSSSSDSSSHDGLGSLGSKSSSYKSCSSYSSGGYHSH